MKKLLLVSLLILTVCGASAQDVQQTRVLVEVFKEKAEQDKLIKQIRTVERDQQTVFKKIKATYASLPFPESIKTSYKNILLSIGTLCAIIGTAAIIHHLTL